jgi:predicted RNA-binding protein YlxR (DUF448 family)
VVRTQAGTIEIDPRGKLPGRGAYICPTWQCWLTALEPKKLERVLKCQVSVDDVMALRIAVVSLLGGLGMRASGENTGLKAEATGVEDALSSG